MPQPTPYDRQYNFTNYQAESPSSPLPGNEVDNELNASKITLDQILARLALIQRDDGKIANDSISYDQLSVDLTVGLSPAVIWTTATSYTKNAVAFVGLLLYRATVAHVSAVFATDLAAGKWVLVADFTPPDNTITNAKLVDMATARIKGRTTAGTGVVEDLTVAQVIDMLGLNIGSQVQAFDADLSALAALSSTGIAARTAANTWVTRTLLAATGLLWANADGVSGAPSIALDINALTVDNSPTAGTDYVLTRKADGTHRKVLVSNVAGAAGAVTDVNNRSGSFTPYYAGSVENFGLAPTVATNALTIALKDAAGADPSSASRVTAVFRNATLTTGTPVVRQGTAALSLVVPSGAELGVADAEAFNLVVALVDNGDGTVQMAVKNTSAGGVIYPTPANGLLTSTTIDTASDSAGVWYSTSGVTSKPYVLLGRLVYGANPLASKGAWATAPDIVEMMHPGFRLPGALLQSIPATLTSYLGAGTTVVPRDGTIPQQSETNAVLSQAITPGSHANYISARGLVQAEYTAASWVIAALFKDSVGNALAVTPDFITGTSTGRAIPVEASFRAGSTSSITLKLNGAGVNAGTFMANGDSAITHWGGGSITSLVVEEYQG